MTMTMTIDRPAVQPTETVDANLFAAKTTCLIVSKRSFGNTKKASMIDVTVAADKALLRLTKTLIESPELEAIAKLDGEVQSYLNQHTGKSVVRGGRTAPIVKVQQITAAMREFAARREALVEAAAIAYPNRVVETSQRLGVVHSVSDYPSVQRFRASFGFDYSWMEWSTPGRLQAISDELFEEERAKASAMMAREAADWRQERREALSALVSNLITRLTPSEDGKPKRLHETAVGHLHTFLASYEEMDTTSDSELAAIVQQARGVMSGVDKKGLKDSPSLAGSVMQNLQRLQEVLEPLVAERSRMISFDDGE